MEAAAIGGKSSIKHKRETLNSTLQYRKHVMTAAPCDTKQVPKIIMRRLMLKGNFQWHKKEIDKICQKLGN